MSANRTVSAARSMPAALLQSVILTVLFTALGVSLPVIFHRLGIPSLRFSPMHFPVLLASFLLGPASGAFIGAASVLISTFLTGMPVVFPTGIAMMFELAVYGIFASVFHRKMFSAKKSYTALLASLILAMILGRLVNGAVQTVIALLSSAKYSFPQFWNSCFVVSLPGILAQIVILPLAAFGILKSEILERKE